MGAQESAARNKNDGIEIGEEFDKSSGLYKVWSHVNSCTKNKKTKGTIFTRKWDCPAETRKYIENGVKLLKKLHHPGVVTFLDCQESPGQLSLMTERVQVLDLCISSLSFVEVHSGLCQILEVLLFLHEKAKIGHNNICPCSIFVTSNGEWKMGGFELAQPVETASTDFLKSQFYKTTKCARFSPPDEMSSKQTGLERDAYAFGRLIDYVLCHLPPDEIIDEELSLSLRDISEKMTNVETLEDLSCLTESYAFSNELTAITNFLNRIQIKSQDEKEAFYKGIEQRLRALPADVVARRLCRLVVSRYVILEPLSHEYLYPSLLTPQDSKTPGILPLDLYKTHLLPEIVRVFAVKETSVRLGLLTHFTRYASHIPPNILECFVVDEVVRGSRDVDDRLVAASLRAMADLVIILGAERVCDWKLTKCFMDGTASKKSSTTKLSNGSAVTGRKTEHKAKTAKPVVKVEKVKERVVPPPSIPRETTPPPREEQTQEDQTVWEDADDWSEDWNTTAGQEEKVEMKEEVKPVTPPSPVVLPSTKTTTKKENGIGSTFEIKASKGLEDDFFADMAPEIKTGGTIIDKLIALQKEKETTPSVPADLSSKFAMSADDVEEDTNWGGWEEEEAVEPPREKSLEAAIPNESDPVETEMKDRPHLQSHPRHLKMSNVQRKSLPVLQDPRDNYSIWEIIRPNLGKDFSRFAVPVWLNEPLSFLQRLAEVMQYVDLLETAAAQSDPVDRLAHIGAFVVAGLSPNFCRLSKPFNPLLLETFEVERNGCRFVAEQVSHHPPVSALHVEGPSFIMSATVSPKISFGFNKLTCHPGATYKVYLKKTQEEYIYEGPTCTIYNVMLGKMYMNITGHATIRCVDSDLHMQLNFDAGKGWHFKTLDVHVDGHILDGKKKLLAVYGNWTHFFATCGVDTLKNNYSTYQQLFKESLETNKIPMFSDSQVLWVANAGLPDLERQFRFTAFSLTLNEMTPELRKSLPPTDSRFRQDMKAYEGGHLEEAEEWKLRLEDQQRQRRKEGAGQVPKWFTHDGVDWNFTGEYLKRDWRNSVEIFDVN